MSRTIRSMRSARGAAPSAHAPSGDAVSRRTLLAASGLGLGLVAPWHAALAGTPGVDEPPLPGPDLPVALPVPQSQTLDNGLTVIVVPRRGTPLVTALLVVRSGAEQDPVGKAGTAGLTATLLGRGAVHGGRAQDAVALAREAESMGGDLSLGSGVEASQAGMTVIAPQLSRALALLADVVRQPTFPAAEVERTRAERLDELRLRLSSPGAVAGMAARRAFWGDRPYGASPTPASIARIGREDLQRFHAQGYRPDRTALVLVGDIDGAQARSLAQRHLGRWRSPSAAPVAPAASAASAAAPAAAPLLPPRLIAIDMGDTGQSAVIVAAPYTSSGAEDRYVALLANAVLGTGFSSRLSQEVRVKRGLAYGAFSGAASHREGGILLAEAQTKSESAAEVAGLLREELLRLGREPPTPQELAARRALLLGSYGRQGETTGALASLVASTWVRGQPLSDLARYGERVLAVTPQQVGDWAAARWTPQVLRTVIAGDAQAAAQGLKPLLQAGDAWSGPLSQVDFDRATLVR